MSEFLIARKLLQEFKGDAYVNGFGVLPRVGPLSASLGRSAALVRDNFLGADEFASAIRESLQAAGLAVAGVLEGARPNAPREDLARITAQLAELRAGVTVSFGGGSTIDAVKAAEVLRALGGSIDDYFGVGQVTKALSGSGMALRPHVAVQTAASSGAHLTKYSNITDLATSQKKLIVDEAIVPPRAVFDYAVTLGAPAALTADGALDGVSHCLEVLYSAVGKPFYSKMERVAGESIRLVMKHLPNVLRNPSDATGREALGLATDLGGYAIMLGGTSGAHLTSFSLIDIMSHGGACALLNPYYAVFFAPTVPGPLKLLGSIARDLGYSRVDIDRTSGRELGVVVAEALVGFLRKAGLPWRLKDVPGFSQAHIHRALAAAKDPQLKMKLENMPVPLTAEMVDEYMGPILEAAASGDLSLIKNV
ncbi:MAG: iron-containing alcohol dehydrogenase [Acidobacteria bacterium]|nr:iron-containing alcohol dehydrogenase [Acidobacteriota bacterium]